MPNERLNKLEALLQRQPRDTFLLYALALEYKKSSESAKALECLGRVLELDGEYCYAYHQKGLIHEAAGNLKAAAECYRAGVEAAKRKGDSHAANELRMALEAIE